MVGECRSETQRDLDKARKDQLQDYLDQLQQECHQVHRLNLAFHLAETPRPGVAWTTALEVDLRCFLCGGPHMSRDCPQGVAKRTRPSEASLAFALSVKDVSDNALACMSCAHVVAGEGVVKVMGAIDSACTGTVAGENGLDAYQQRMHMVLILLRLCLTS